MIFGLLTFLAFFVPAYPVSAQTQNQEVSYIERARVLQVLTQTIQDVPGTQTSETVQTLQAQILEGPDKGKTVTVDNDRFNLKVGDEFYANHSIGGMDAVNDTWNVQEPYRLPTLEMLVVLFVLTIIIFGGKQGIRGLVSLIASLAVIFYILLPGILAGYSPVLLSVGISSFIIVIGSYITHGFNRTTSAAVLGMIATICVTGALAYWSVHAAMLSGYSSEEVTYLHFATNGTIDFVGLLLGGIMIGLLGILYDAAIGQAIAVEELKRAAAHYSHWELYRRALRIGREHIGALVNTLAIAYVGVSLPLLLLLHFTDMSIAATINQELFATEIVRTMVGSIGLILAVPLTTLISVWMLRKGKPSDTKSEGHSHSHAH
ncbi:MAG: YibE/F family protein [Patescibacteria group bacterium]|nr:YibE/F family protein [Patescibacteria group bacterium]